MTYENVISWLEKNVPLENFDNFSEWYEASEEAVQTPALFGTSQFNRMMEDRWLNEFGTFDKSEPEEIPIQSGVTEIPIIDESKVFTSKGKITTPTRNISIPSPSQEPIITESGSTSQKIPVIIPRDISVNIRKPVIVLPKQITNIRFAIFDLFKAIFRRRK